MKKSKYLNKAFGPWICTHVGISHVQGKRARYAGHRTYYYIFERMTSDNKAEKLIRLNCKEAAKVYQGKTTVEEIVAKREKTAAKSNKKPAFSRKISYHFVDREG